MNYIGIDPGLGGAFAVLCPSGAIVFDTPSAAVKKGNDYLVGGMRHLITEYGKDAYAVLESGIAMPRQSSSTTAKTFRGIGLWEGMLVMAGIPYELVPPATWKRALAVPADKAEARIIAQRLFPDVASGLARVKDHGRAEALLIAEWGRRRTHV